MQSIFEYYFYINILIKKENIFLKEMIEIT